MKLFILRCLILCALTLALTGTTNSQTLTHPRLYYSASDVASLRAKKTDTFYKSIYDEILVDCRSSYGPGDPIPDSSRQRNAQAIYSHGALLLLDPTGLAVDPKYQSNTRFFSYYFATLNMSGWSNFFSTNIQDSTCLLIALCVGYDMHYDKFTPSQRADIVSKLAARADYILTLEDFGIIPEKLGTEPWGYLATNKMLRNRNMMPIGALGMIAYTLEGEVDESRRQTWLAKVDLLLGTWDKYVAHDGMSHEGYEYHEYMIRYLFPMLYARSKRTGVNQFKKYAYIKNHPYYSIYSWIPGGDRSWIQPIPFGDCETAVPSPMPTVISLSGRMLKGDSSEIDHLCNWMQYRAPGQTPNCAYYRVEATQYFWVDPSISIKSPQQINLPLFHSFPDRGGFVWRSGWDNMATYFAMTCGPTIGGHQQPEMGNFVIHKGGAPFIAHHGYCDTRLTEDHNVMMVNGQGQWGDRYATDPTTTEPMPPSKWASIKRVVADDNYFDVYTDLKPIYRETTIERYNREFVQTNGVIFIADRLKTSGYLKAESILNAYCTTQDEYDPDKYTSLDIDSNMGANPWYGSGRTHTVKPRSSGPYTGSMTVQDLSSTGWTPTVTPSIVNNIDDDMVQRGYRLVLSRTGSIQNLLVATYFSLNGRQIVQWPTSSDGDGFLIKMGSTTQALGLWSASGSVSNSQGLTMTGQMGGLDLVAKSIWGREITKLQYNGRTYLTSSSPVSVFCTPTTTGYRMRLQSDASATISVYMPDKPLTVKLNGSSQSSWNWSNSMLTMTVPAQSKQALLETTKARNAVDQQSWAVYE